MKTGERIREYRIRAGKTMEELATAVHTSRQTIYRYECGETANIPRRRLEDIGRVLDVSPAVLMGWGNKEETVSGLFPLNRRAVPMLGSVACGEPVYAEQDFCGYELAEEGVDADFCLRASGDSMIGARIYDGDIVFVRAQDAVEDGQIAVVIIGEEATLKRFYYDKAGQKVILAPENPRYAPLVFSGEELETVRILGRAVAFQSRIR